MNQENPNNGRIPIKVIIITAALMMAAMLLVQYIFDLFVS